jgi:hypothetical protein
MRPDRLERSGDPVTPCGIADDYDPDADMSADADPVAEFLTYRSHVDSK